MKLFLFFAIICSSILSDAQRSMKIYFDKDWKKTNKIKDAEYYRIINFDAANKPSGLVRDYFMNGKIQYEAIKIYVDTINPRLDTTIGEAKWYAINGQLTQTAFYVNGKKHGENKHWYKTGELNTIGYYDNGELNGEYIAYRQNGNYFYKINYDHGVIVGKKGQYFDTGTYKMDYFADYFHNVNNPYNWKFPDSNEVKCIVRKDTGLYIQNNSAKDAIAYVEIPWTSVGGFTININIKKDSGDPKNGYGIVYDYKDENNYSYFMIQANGNFITGRKFNGTETGDNTWKKTNKLLGNARFDLLTVRRYGTEITFFINEHKVSTGRYIPLTGYGFGVICQKSDQSIVLQALHTYQW